MLHYTPLLHDTDRPTHLHTALTPTRTWFETFSRPTTDFIATPLLPHGSFLLPCGALYRLRLLEYPGVG